MWSSCASCGSIVRIGTHCPTCQATRPIPLGTAAGAVLLGLGLQGCWFKNIPLYGVEITDTVEVGTGDTGAATTEVDTSDTSDTGAE